MRTMHSTLFLLAGFQLAVAVLLAVVPFISATSYPSQPPRRGLHFRDIAVQQRDGLPQGWSSLGCYSDDPAQPTLTSTNFVDTGMTVEFCVNNCNTLKNIYAGLENGEYCYCGNVTTIGAKSTPPSDCSSKCVGDPSESCGGSNRLNLYWSGAAPPPQPTIVPNVGRWNYAGCFTDSNDARTLTVKTPVGSKFNYFNISVKACVSACGDAGYPLAGVEFANECWCDNGIKNGGQEIDTKYCMLACSGDSSEICGGGNSLVVYHNNR